VLGLAACGGGSFDTPRSDGGGQAAGPGDPCGVAGSCTVVPLGDAGEIQGVGIVPSPMPDAGTGTPSPCGSGGPCGSVAGLPPEAGTDVTDDAAVGPDSGPDAHVDPCGSSPCGIGPIPPDAGKSKAPDGGDEDASTAGADAGHGPCGGGPCGVIIMPDAGRL